MDLNLTNFNCNLFRNNFSISDYLRTNFQKMHPEDMAIMRHLARYYATCPRNERILEVGVGPNLYPIMAMLPVAEKIRAIDINDRNIQYMKGQQIHPDSFWNRFWQYIGSQSIIYNYDFRSDLENKVTFETGNFFDYSTHHKYDVVSFNSFAESITSDYWSFRHVCNRILNFVKPGGTVISVFMSGSNGYQVGAVNFPAFPIKSKIVRQIFSPAFSQLKIVDIPKAVIPIRDGYDGMIFMIAQRHLD